MVFELLQKLHLQIYASQFMTSYIIPLPFVLLNLESVGKITKIWISQERKELFRWDKNIFHSFWRAIIWWKNKKLIKIADISFNVYQSWTIYKIIKLCKSMQNKIICFFFLYRQQSNIYGGAFLQKQLTAKSC